MTLQIRRKINEWLRRIPIWLVWLLGLIPLALLILDGFRGNLGVDPVVSIEHRLGKTALYFLIGGLCATPVTRLLRVNLIRFRQAVGLLAFTYAVLHLIAWAVFDMGLRWSQALSDIVKRPYLTLGMIAFVALIPLAVTSNRASIRRLGAAGWQKLHRLVYVAVPFAALHYLWVGKVAKPEPLLWIAIITILLLYRLRT